MGAEAGRGVPESLARAGMFPHVWEGLCLCKAARPSPSHQHSLALSPLPFPFPGAVWTRELMVPALLAACELSDKCSRRMCEQPVDRGTDAQVKGMIFLC